MSTHVSRPMSIRAIGEKLRLSVRQRRTDQLLNAAVRCAERADWIKEIKHQAEVQGWVIPTDTAETMEYMASFQQFRALGTLQRACEVEEGTLRGLGARGLVRR